MRKWILAALLMLSFCAAAQASTGYHYSSDGDLYYHDWRQCSGIYRGYHIEEEILKQQGKHPCPVCVERYLPAEISAVERGGTAVIRIPDSWLKALDDEYVAFRFAI